MNLDKTKVTDEDLRLFGKLRRAHTLSFNFTTVSDAGMAHLRHCREVRYLGLAETKVTSAGLANVADMSNLDHLILQDTPVDDRGVEHLRKLRRLSYVNLGDTKVTAKCVESLAQLPALRGLNLSRADVVDSALPHLLTMKQLGHVDLTGTQLSGAALLELDDNCPYLEFDAETVDCSGMQLDGTNGESNFKQLAIRLRQLNDENRLKLIDFSRSQITDHHLSSLHGLNRLQMLVLRDTRVTDEGAKALLESIPNCQIRR